MMQKKAFDLVRSQLGLQMKINMGLESKMENQNS